MIDMRFNVKTKKVNKDNVKVTYGVLQYPSKEYIMDISFKCKMNSIEDFEFKKSKIKKFIKTKYLEKLWSIKNVEPIIAFKELGKNAFRHSKTKNNYIIIDCVFFLEKEVIHIKQLDDILLNEIVNYLNYEF